MQVRSTAAAPTPSTELPLTTSLREAGRTERNLPASGIALHDGRSDGCTNDGPALAHARLVDRVPLCLVSSERVLRVVEAPPALPADAVAVEVLVVWAQADKAISSALVAQPPVRNLAALFDCTHSQERQDDKRNCTKGGDDADDRVFPSLRS